MINVATLNFYSQPKKEVDMLAKHIVPIIGSKRSGRTQLYNRLITQQKNFEADPKILTGPQIGVKKYPDQNLEIQFWDFGPDIGTEQINASLKRASKICMVFDATDPHWLQTVATYLALMGIELPEDVAVLLIGTKIDLLDSAAAQQQIASLAQDYARRTLKGTYWAVSAKTDRHLDELSQQIITGLPALPFKRPVFNGMCTPTIPKTGAFARALHDIMSDARNGLEIDPDRLIFAAIEADSQDFENKKIQTLLSSYPSKSPHKRSTVVEESSIRTNVAKKIDFDNVSDNPLYSETVYPPLISPDTPSSFALRLVGMALILAAVTSLIYVVVVVVAGFVSSASLIAVVNQIVLTVGSLLGMSAPVLGFAKAAATIGLSPTTATMALSATASGLMGIIGYSLFKRNTPARSRRPDDDREDSSLAFPR